MVLVLALMQGSPSASAVMASVESWHWTAHAICDIM